MLAAELVLPFTWINIPSLFSSESCCHILGQEPGNHRCMMGGMSHCRQQHFIPTANRWGGFWSGSQWGPRHFWNQIMQPKNTIKIMSSGDWQTLLLSSNRNSNVVLVKYAYFLKVPLPPSTANCFLFVCLQKAQPVFCVCSACGSFEGCRQLGSIFTMAITSHKYMSLLGHWVSSCAETSLSPKKTMWCKTRK